MDRNPLRISRKSISQSHDRGGGSGRQQHRLLAIAERSFGPAARISGYGYMIAGSLLALAFLPGALHGTPPDGSSVASTLTAVDSTTEEVIADGDFDIDFSTTFTTEVPIVYRTDSALESVLFYAIRQSTGEVYTIGEGEQQSDGSWVRAWQLDPVSADTYRIAANINGEAFKDRADKLVKIEKHVSEKTTDVSPDIESNPDESTADTVTQDSSIDASTADESSTDTTTRVAAETDSLVEQSVLTVLRASINGTQWETDQLLVGSEDTVTLQWIGQNASQCEFGARSVRTGGETNGKATVPEPQPGETVRYEVVCSNDTDKDAARIDITSDTSDTAKLTNTTTEYSKPSLEFVARVNGKERFGPDIAVSPDDAIELRWDSTGVADECSVSSSEQTLSQKLSGSLNIPTPPVRVTKRYSFYCRDGEFGSSKMLAITTNELKVQATTSEEKIEKVVRPEIDLRIQQNNDDLNGAVMVGVDTASVSFVELYARNIFSNRTQFISLANRISPGQWQKLWDTRNIPNATYDIVAKVKNEYGVYESDPVRVVVNNQTERAKDSETTEVLRDTAAVIDEEVGSEPDQPIVDSVIEQQISDVSNGSSGTAGDTSRVLDRVYAQFEQSVDIVLGDYRRALRNGNEESVARAEEELAGLRGDMLLEIRELISDDVALMEIGAELEDRLAQRLSIIRKRETVIKERIGEAATRDSDGDQITDYDEINLYGTDPNSADTDNDGFVDSVEIARGFDPLNSNAEAVVQYESPKQVDVVRDDILEVTSITDVSASATATSTDGVQSQAIISGRGIPNSFVTLYIFSEPIVVTVRTDETGSWSYTFDKELADGTHEVYVGITDNAGRIVARSNPLSFVKTAEAFTPIGGTAGSLTASPDEFSFTSEKVVMLIGAISVVAMGALLVALGMFVDRRKRPELTESAYV